MTRAIGIDIGSTKIKIAEISVAKTREVVGLYEIERRDDLSISDLIRDFFSVNSIQGERIGVGIGATPVMIRQNAYAFSNTKEIKAAIRSDLEDTLPFELDEYLIDEKFLWKRGKMRHYMVGLCPLDRVDELNLTFDEAGVIPNSYLLDTQAIANLALDQCLPAGLSGEIYAVIDIGYSSTKLAILRGATPAGMKKKEVTSAPNPEILEIRVLERGLKDLAKFISQKESIGIKESLEWIRHRAEILSADDAANSTPIMREVSDSIKTALRPLLVEIYQTFQSVKGFEDALPSQVYLSGPITMLKGFVSFVGFELRAESEIWNVFDGYDLSSLPAVNDEKLLSFASALALAHRYSTLSSNGWLNFRRSSQAQKALLSHGLKDLFNKETRSAWLSIAAMVGFAMFYSTMGSYFAQKERTELAKGVSSQFRRMDPALATVGARSATDLEKSQALFDREQKVRERDLRVSAPRMPTDILLDLSEAIPVGYKISDFVVDKNRKDGTFRANINQAESTATMDLKDLKKVIEKNLQDKGYHRVKMEADKSGKVHLRALWKGGAL